jgi:hypothetical protein
MSASSMFRKGPVKNQSVRPVSQENNRRGLRVTTYKPSQSAAARAEKLTINVMGSNTSTILSKYTSNLAKLCPHLWA